MPRVKRSVHARKKRRKVLEQAKGYWGLKSTNYKYAKEQVERSLSYAYRDRKVRKREFRKLWIQRINAACRPSCRVRWMARAISWPSMTSKSVSEVQATGSKPGCHQGRRSPMASGEWEQQASILARSQPCGRKPSIIEPANVVSRFMRGLAP